MLFVIDNRSLNIVVSAGILQPVTSYSQKVGGNLPIEVQFVEDGIPVAAPGGYIIWEIKPNGHYQAQPLVRVAGGFTAPADPTTGYYTANANLADPALLNQFGDTTTQIAGMLEIAWAPDAGHNPTRTANSPLFNLVNYIISDADLPTSQEMPSIVVWLSGITGLTGGAGTDLDGLATLGVRPLGQVVAIIYQGVENHYQLTTGNPASNPPDVVIPVDHNPAINNVYWQRIPQGATAGIQGAAGYSVLNGVGAPGAGIGRDGDFYVDTQAWYYYGPKAAGAWPAGFSIRGPQGASSAIIGGNGAPGANTGNNGDCYVDTASLVFYGPKANGGWPAGVPMIGSTWITGSGAPSGAIGRNGDWYIDNVSLTVYGPKTGGLWPAGRNLIGPKGLPGVNANKIIGLTTPPTPQVGNDGDYAIDVVDLLFYGPKVNGAWPAAVPMYGNTLLSGNGVPSPNNGHIGDFYIDVTGRFIYGPKTAQGWGVGTTLQPSRILSGAGAPLPTTGNIGDFWIDSVKLLFYGPKTTSTTWPLPVSIASPPSSIIQDGQPIVSYREVGTALKSFMLPGTAYDIATAGTHGSVVRALAINQTGAFKFVFLDFWLSEVGQDWSTGTRFASNVKAGSATTLTGISVLDLISLPLDAKGAKFLAFPENYKLTMVSAMPPAPPNYTTGAADILPDVPLFVQVDPNTREFSIQLTNNGNPITGMSLVTPGVFNAVTGETWEYKYTGTNLITADVLSLLHASATAAGKAGANFGMSGAPSTITIGSDGTISGTWPQAGLYTFNAWFIAIGDSGPLAVDSYYDTLQVLVTDRPIDTAPAGVTFDPDTATISGTINVNGQWWLLFKSGNSYFWFGIFGLGNGNVALTATASVGDYGPGGMSGLFTVLGLVKGDGQGNIYPAVAGEDYVAPNGDGSQLTNLHSAQLTDSTLAGRNLLTAADVPAQLALLGLTNAANLAEFAQLALLLNLPYTAFGFSGPNGSLYSITPTADLEFDFAQVGTDFVLGAPLRFPAPGGTWYALKVEIVNNVPQLSAYLVPPSSAANASGLKFTQGAANYTIAIDSNALPYWVPA